MKILNNLKLSEKRRYLDEYIFNCEKQGFKIYVENRDYPPSSSFIKILELDLEDIVEKKCIILCDQC